MAASMNPQVHFCRALKFPNVFLSAARVNGNFTYCRRAFFSRYIRACAAGTQNQPSIITPDSRVDKEVVEFLSETCVGSSSHIKYQNHLGVMRRSRTPQIPVRLLRAMKVLLEKYPIQALESKTQQLVRYLQARHPPTSQKELVTKTKEVEEKILTDPMKAYLHSLEGKDLEVALEKHRKKVLSKLRSVIYHWQPMQFDAYTSYIYLIGRMSWDYSVILQCFTEISKRDAEFKPFSTYCHGSKVGSSIWAADTIWKRIQEHFCVDSSGFMNTIARLLLQDGNEQVDVPYIKGVVFRQFQPSPKMNMFSLVISPYMLMEQASAEERLQLVHDLWEMTETYLVLIENGTNAGFNLIDEAREFLLSLSDSSHVGHVFAPCPHDKVCPKKSLKGQPCLAETTYMEVDLMNEDKKKKSFARYSYVIMKKGPRKSDSEWPRVLMNGKGVRHFHCHLCLPSGQYQHVVISKGKFDKHLYNCTKRSQLGDRLPVSLSSVSPDISTIDAGSEDENGPSTSFSSPIGADHITEEETVNHSDEKSKEGSDGNIV